MSSTEAPRCQPSMSRELPYITHQVPAPDVFLVKILRHVADLLKADVVVESEADYHAESKSGRYMSSGMLKIFRESPALYKMKVDGLTREKDTAAYSFGRVLHTLVLEGVDTFMDMYAWESPVNPRTQKPYSSTTKVFAEWVQNQMKPLTCTRGDYADAAKLAYKVRQFAHAADLLREGVAEAVVRTTWSGVRVQARIDWYSPKYGIVDLKTCDKISEFENDAIRYEYVHQLAFYIRALSLIAADNIPLSAHGGSFIVVEKRPPYAVGVWEVPTKLIAIADEENHFAIERLKRCLGDDEWPTGYEKKREITRLRFSGGVA